MTRLPVRATAFTLLRTLIISLVLLGAGIPTEADTSATDGSTPSNLSPGAPAGSYKLNGFTSVNLFNGNLDMHLPLSDITGRGTASAGLILPVEIRWRIGMYTYVSVTGQPDTIIYATYKWWNNISPGYGPGIIQGRSTSPQPSCGPTLFRLTFTAADGTEYELRDQLNGGRPGTTTVVSSPAGSHCVAQQNRGTVFVTADGSAATFVSDAPLNDGYGTSGVPHKPSGYLLLRDGTRYRFDNSLMTWMRDRNGNLTSFSYDASGRVISATDSLDRQVTVTYGVTQARPYGQCDQAGYSCDEITYNGFGGAPRTVRVTKTNLSNALRSGYSIQTVNALFPEYSGGSTVNPTVTSAVWMPNGQAYRLYYNSYIELARVELPTGGAIEYDHSTGFSSGSPNGANGNQGIYRRVTEARTYTKATDPNSLSSKTTFSRPESLTSVGGIQNVGHVEVDHKTAGGVLQSRERHYYYGSAASVSDDSTCPYPHWQKGIEYQSDQLAADGTTLLRRVAKTWQQRATLSWWSSWNAQYGYQCTNSEPANDPRLVQTVTTLSDTNQVTRQSAVNPTNGSIGYDQYNNPTDVWEYDYGMGVSPTYAVRHTHSEYLTTNPANGVDYTSYTGAHIRGLPTSQQVYAVNPTNGTETLVSQSATAYDEPAYPTLTYGTVTGWADPGTAARGNATTVSLWLNTNNTWISRHAQYDQVGNLRNSWDANNNQTQFSYSDSFSDGNNARNTYAYPTTTTSAVPDSTNTYGANTPLTTSLAYDFSTGLVTLSTDANGKFTETQYADPLDRVTQVSQHDGGRTTYTYNDMHQCGPAMQTRTLLDAAGRQTDSWQFYDGFGRPYLSQTFENQDTNNPYVRVDTQYDPMGRSYRVSNPYRSPGCTATANPSGRWTMTAYDALGRVKSATTPDGAAVTSSYSGNQVTVADEAGRKRVGVSDALGRLTQTTEDPTAGGFNYVTNYTYDVLGNLRKVDQGGQVRFFMYDSLSRLVRAKNPEQAAGSVIPNMTDPVTGNSQWSLAYGYDSNGNLTARVDARGVTTNYTYDALNRNTAVSYTDGTPGVGRAYDKTDNGRGRLSWDWTCGANGCDSLNSYNYDAVGRAYNKNQYFGSGNIWSQPYSTYYAYDRAGNVTGMTYPSGHTVSYNYDQAGRVSGFAGDLGDGVQRAYSSGVTYDEMGGIRREQFGTRMPLYHKLHYNVRGQLYAELLSSVNDDWNWNRGMLVNHYGSGDFQTWGTSGPNNNGNVLRSHHYVPNDDQVSGYTVFFQDYEYDSLNRLSKVTETNSIAWQAQYAQKYEYDRWGNRTINAGQTWSAPEPQFELRPQANQEVAEPSNRLYAPGDSNRAPSQKLMRYDAAGNLTYDGYTGQGARAYDAENRMTQAQDSNQQWSTYTYDSDGRRVRRLSAGQETWQVYGVGGELLAEYQAGAATFLAAKEYGYRSGELLVTMSSGDTQRLRRFIRNLYYNCLARDPNPAESRQKTDQLAQAGVQGGEAQLLSTARTIARGLFESPDYAARNRTNTEYVTDLYHAYLQRAPDTDGLGFWVQDAQNNGRAHTLRSFEVSTEFATLSATVYGTAREGDDQRVNHFIDEFYLGAYNGFPAEALRQQQAQRLNNAAAVSQERVKAEARLMGAEIFEATNYNSTHSDSQYVIDLYEAFLQRAPDGLGMSFWVSKVQGEGRASALAGFQDSAEFGELAGTLYRETFWIVPDHLGTPRMVVDKSGSLAGVKRHDYLPFGGELIVDIGGRAPSQGYAADDNVRQTFAGYEHDTETGYEFAQARYYSNMQGRFTSVDPLPGSAKAALPQSWNRYSYCVNNPFANTDPTGKVWGRLEAGGVLIYLWFNTEKQMRDSGATEVTDFLFYDDIRHSWVSMDRNSPQATFISDFDYYLGFVNGMNSLRHAGLAEPADSINTGRNVPGRAPDLDVRVTAQGLAILKQHLTELHRAIDEPENQMMIAMIENAFRRGKKISGPAKDFYLHEIAEASMTGAYMKQGMTFDEAQVLAHNEALRRYNTEPYALYDYKVIMKTLRDEKGYMRWHQNYLDYWEKRSIDMNELNDLLEKK